MKIRTRIFLVFLLVLLLGFGSIVKWLYDDLRPRYLEAFEEPLIDSSHMLAELFGPMMELPDARERLHEVFSKLARRRINARIFALERTRVDVRVYVTDRNGNVIFDSDNGRDEGADYSNWNDVRRTLGGRYGARSTRGDPLYPQGSVAYVAAAIKQNGQIIGVVSIGKPKRNLELFLALARRDLIVSALVASLLCVLIAWVLHLWVTRPLQKLVDYTAQASTGARVNLPDLGNNEVGEVGRAMERMREALQGKQYAQRYIQALAHELKSPLSAIQGAAELLQEQPPPEAQQQFTENIRREGDRLRALIERLLVLVSIESMSALERSDEIDLTVEIRNAIERYDNLIQQKSITIQQELGEQLLIKGDLFLLRQAINNLLDNAISYSPRGASIFFSHETSAAHVVVTIQDQGPGIPDYAMERVFERFYSLPRPDTQQRSTGLGLNLVKEIVELHGGALNLENLEQGGLQVRLILPRRDISD